MIHKKRHHAFTLLELVFVIVIMGILGKFGIEFLAQAYRNFIFSKVNNELQSNSAYAVEVVSKRLEHRIKQSIIYRNLNLGNSDVNFRPLDSGSDANATVLEWVSADIDGYRGENNAYWSGVLDLNLSNATNIVSLETNTTAIDNLIRVLADNPASSTTTINDAAIYFVGTFITNDEWGWDGNATKFLTQANVNIHPINSAGASQFISPTGNFTGVDATEYYKLAWTAYAVSLEDFDAANNMGNLYLYSNYQPWQGEQYNDAGIGIDKHLLMQNVSSFQFRVAGSLMKIQICTKSVLLSNEEYSLCKEKTVY